MKEYYEARINEVKAKLDLTKMGYAILCKRLSEKIKKSADDLLEQLATDAETEIVKSINEGINALVTAKNAINTLEKDLENDMEYYRGLSEKAEETK